MSRTVDDVVVDAHQRVIRLEELLDDAKDDYARTVARAQIDHRRSAGDISRLLGAGVTPDQVSYAIRTGRRLLELRARRAGRQAA